jgi:hypothetical protein
MPFLSSNSKTAGFVKPGEVVVDLCAVLLSPPDFFPRFFRYTHVRYAGIGYFTIPFIKGGAAHVHACEMNPNRCAAHCDGALWAAAAADVRAASRRCGGILWRMTRMSIAQCMWMPGN